VSGMVTSRSDSTCCRLAAAAAALFTGALCLAADTVEGDAGRRLDAAVAATAGAGFRGAVLVAEKGKTLLAKGYGAADGAKSPMTAESLFDVASVSKQFTAAAIFKLAERRSSRSTTRSRSTCRRSRPTRRRSRSSTCSTTPRGCRS